MTGSPRDKTYVKVVPDKGRAVFANKRLRKGDEIECSPVLVFTVQTTEMAPFSYEYAWDDEDDVEHREWWIGLGHTSLYNHSHEPNADYELIDDDVDGPRIRIVALRRIAADEEIMIDYTGDGEPWPLKNWPGL